MPHINVNETGLASLFNVSIDGTIDVLSIYNSNINSIFITGSDDSNELSHIKKINICNHDAVNEIFSRELDKWVLIDVSRCICFYFIQWSFIFFFNAYSLKSQQQQAKLSSFFCRGVWSSLTWDTHNTKFQKKSCRTNK